MATTSTDQVEKAEREALCDLFLELGPDAPTLCAGWTTGDIAVHLIVCEARPHAWLAVPIGDRIGLLDRYFERLVAKERARGWEGLVDRVRRGASFGPTRYQPVRERMMTREFVIHHEDVRRANGLGVRAGIPAVQEVAWRKLPAFARRMLVVADQNGFELIHPDGRHRTMKPGAPVVQLTGEPLEQLLYAFGRTSAARVEVVGDAGALRVRDTSALAALPRVRTGTGSGG
ncbi:MAG: TIGR03085 family metal-binding protein [Acidimicrobiia bacterium]